MNPTGRLGDPLSPSLYRTNYMAGWFLINLNMWEVRVREYVCSKTISAVNLLTGTKELSEIMKFL